MIDIKKVALNVELDNGIWYSKKKDSISYPEDANSLCYQIEENSFWFKHRNNCIKILMQKFHREGIFIDAGGGNGFVTKALQDKGFNTILLEPGEGVINAKKRGVKNIIKASLQTDLFYKDVISSIGIFDVLEHIKDDDAFLKTIFSVLKNDGHIFITVPAYQLLWSYEDDIAGHFRRYTLRTIIEKLENNGFKVLYKSYLFSFLPLPIFLSRTIKKLKPASLKNLKKDHELKDNFANKIITFLLKAEEKKIKNSRRISFGSSCIIVAEKLIK